jgi:hypothetical protein
MFSASPAILPAACGVSTTDPEDTCGSGYHGTTETADNAATRPFFGKRARDVIETTFVHCYLHRGFAG